MTDLGGGLPAALVRESVLQSHPHPGAHITVWFQPSRQAGVAVARHKGPGRHRLGHRPIPNGSVGWADYARTKSPPDETGHLPNLPARGRANRGERRAIPCHVRNVRSRRTFCERWPLHPPAHSGNPFAPLRTPPDAKKPAQVRNSRYFAVFRISGDGGSRTHVQGRMKSGVYERIRRSSLVPR